MSDFLAQFGVSREDIPRHAELPDYPKPVSGRVAEIDADFIAYQVSAETKDELDGIKPRKTLEDMQYNATSAVEHLMRLAGAERYRCHITPSGSNKGGRALQAIQHEYQSARAGRAKPEHLDTIRAFIASDLNGVVHLDQEADDGMARANYDAQGPNGAWGKSSLSVIVSMDKDLRMVPGLHLDFDTDKLHCVGDSFGTIWIDDTKSAKTLKGWGTKFFWAQCLMGDKADTILGLPEAPGSVVCEFTPTAAYKKLYDRWMKEEDPAKAKRLSDKLDADKAKTKKVGAVLAYEFLKDVRNDKEAFHFVRDAWRRLETEHGYEFKHWVTGERVTSTQALLGDMQLLWMRRNDNPNDVLEWIKEKCV